MSTKQHNTELHDKVQGAVADGRHRPSAANNLVIFTKQRFLTSMRCHHLANLMKYTCHL